MSRDNSFVLNDKQIFEAKRLALWFTLIAYGKDILQELSRRLTKEFGRGFSYENLKLMRRFYMVYSKDVISDSAFSHSEQFPMTTEGRRFYLSWSHYLILIRINSIENAISFK